MPKKSLRVASDDDLPRPPMTVSEAVTSGSRIDQLIAMRRIAADAIDDTDTAPRDLKALMISVNDFSKEIDELRAIQAEEALDAEAYDGNVSTAWRPEAI